MGQRVTRESLRHTAGHLRSLCPQDRPHSCLTRDADASKPIGLNGPACCNAEPRSTTMALPAVAVECHGPRLSEGAPPRGAGRTHARADLDAPGRCAASMCGRKSCSSLRAEQATLRVRRVAAPVHQTRSFVAEAQGKRASAAHRPILPLWARYQDGRGQGQRHQQRYMDKIHRPAYKKARSLTLRYVQKGEHFPLRKCSQRPDPNLVQRPIR